MSSPKEKRRRSLSIDSNPKRTRQDSQESSQTPPVIYDDNAGNSKEREQRQVSRSFASEPDGADASFESLRSPSLRTLSPEPTGDKENQKPSKVNPSEDKTNPSEDKINPSEVKINPSEVKINITAPNNTGFALPGNFPLLCTTPDGTCVFRIPGNAVMSVHVKNALTVQGNWPDEPWVEINIFTEEGISPTKLPQQAYELRHIGDVAKSETGWLFVVIVVKSESSALEALRCVANVNTIPASTGKESTCIAYDPDTPGND